MTPALAAAALVTGLVLAPALGRLADVLAAARGRDAAHDRLRVVVLYVGLPAALCGCVLRFHLHPMLGVAAGFVVVGVLIAVVDLEHRVVPNDVVIPAAVAALAARTAIDPSWEWTVAAAASGGFLLVGAVVAPAGLGMGDVKLAVVLGAVLGRSVLVALVLAFAALFVVSVCVVVRHRRAGLKIGLPFAPFLVAGGVVALLL